MYNSDIKWYTQEHLCVSLRRYLKQKGYEVYKDESFGSGHKDILLFVSDGRERGIIEIKNCIERNTPSQGYRDHEGSTDGKPFGQSGALISSLKALATQYRDKTFPVALCLPRVSYIEKIIQEVSKSFRENNLHLIVYLIGSSGVVEKLDLYNTEVINQTCQIEKEVALCMYVPKQEGWFN
jgi:hypothetical protein